jgi:ABC-2 type transport system ATP-binding protein
MQSTDVPAIQLRGVCFSYGKLPVLDSLDFRAADGEITGLVGANGSGKTTLIRILLGLVAPASGVVELAGESAQSLTVAARQRIGYVPQSPRLFPWLNGASMLRYFGAFYDHYDQAFAAELAGRLKVTLKTPIQSLSPGQQQRLSIVRALGSRPDIVVLDEPMAALDPAGRLEVIEQLAAEQRRRPMSILLSSHITQDLQRLCTHLAVLHGGRIALHAPLGTFDAMRRFMVTGPEAALAAHSFQRARHVRSERNGQRYFVIDAADVDDFQASLPAGATATPATHDLETIVSEWMR